LNQRNHRDKGTQVKISKEGTTYLRNFFELKKFKAQEKSNRKVQSSKAIHWDRNETTGNHTLITNTQQHEQQREQLQEPEQQEPEQQTKQQREQQPEQRPNNEESEHQTKEGTSPIRQRSKPVFFGDERPSDQRKQKQSA
jgi:hypothetical protein